jgi:hypothetical protein
VRPIANDKLCAGKVEFQKVFDALLDGDPSDIEADRPRKRQK